MWSNNRSTFHSAPLPLRPQHQINMSDLEDTAITSRSPIPTSNNPFTPEATPGPSVPPNAAALLKQQKSKKDDMPPVVKLANSKGSDHLDKAFKKNNDNNMSFQSYAAVGIAIGPSQWHPPLQDATIPQTDEQDRGVVCRLFDAMRDIDSALDTENSPYRKRFTPGKDTCYEPWTVEACAWEILVCSFCCTFTGESRITNSCRHSSRPYTSTASTPPSSTHISSLILGRLRTGRSSSASIWCVAWCATPRTWRLRLW